MHEIVVNERLQHLLDALERDAFFDRQLFNVLGGVVRGGHVPQPTPTLSTKTSLVSWKISSIFSRFSSSDKPFFLL